MSERQRFIEDLESNLFTMTELCQQYGISRKTGYKWAARYVSEGTAGLRERSRAPKRSPRRTEQHVMDALTELRRKHPFWGPRKLLAYWSVRRPDWPWPAASTVGEILKRAGLVEPRHRRRRPAHPGPPLVDADAPNRLWTTDFKGKFRMGDRRYCHPLTVADRCSRYLLGCEGKYSTAHAGVQPVFERVFRRRGLPDAILNDNGIPFSSSALAGLSRLSIWWIKLGIELLLISPGHPEQNGAHERMHRTLKAETTRPPAKNLSTQQSTFNAFRQYFNYERPHEALGQRTPGEIYHPSSRPYPRRLAEVEYPGHYEVRCVRGTGYIKWKGDELLLSEVLRGEPIGLEEVDDGIWSIYFSRVLLARLDERERCIRECVRTPKFVKDTKA